MKNSVLKLRIEDDDYEKFQNICETKGKTMSEVIRSFITSYANGQNIILLDLDNETINNSVELCKEKKIKFKDLIKFLLNAAIKNKNKIKFK